MNKVLEGKTICGGIVFGKIRYYSQSREHVPGNTVKDAATEIVRYDSARRLAGRELDNLYERAVQELGRESAEIFSGQRIILEDEEFVGFVKDRILNGHISAEAAVAFAEEQFVVTFANLKEEYFQARSVDIKDVSERLLRILGEMNSSMEDHRKAQWETDGQPVIIMAKELTPSETVQLDKRYLAGMVTRQGSFHSHTGILARTMNIPALTDIQVEESLDGKEALLDGFTGRLILEPDEATVAYYQERIRQEQEKQKQIASYKGRETLTRAGKKIDLYANIGDIADLKSVLENDAEGIGLFRSEFLYLKEEDYPSEEILFRTYRKLAETMQGKTVVIRTLDIGTDKKTAYLQLQPEENPALGYRAIRICLTREAVFKTQLRAILRAAAYGKVSILYPMISSIWEVHRIKEILEEVKAELTNEGVLYGAVEQGIMIETPAAAIISDMLAKEVDFFSIGTNDLTQYTLAVDRQNSELDLFYDAHHEAILRLIHATVENAHKAGIKVGICGELAADTSLIGQFLEMGVDAFSVTPANVLLIRKAILEA